MITPEDLHTAVRRGLISETQAAGLVALSDARAQARASLSPKEEPFMLFRGFNEIFIVIGLSVLFAGWTGLLAAISSDLPLSEAVSVVTGAALTLVILTLVQRYFTLTRRMIAPSIALSVMTGLTLLAAFGALAGIAGAEGRLTEALSFGLAALGMGLHYRVFRVPFDAFLIGAGAFMAVSFGLMHQGVLPEGTLAILHFSSIGLPAALSIGFGVICFTLAMWFDLSDPQRLSTRAATGFWLHVLAAPAIINPVALRMLAEGQGGAVALLAVLLVLAVVALVIDRRSFLVSGAGYAVAVIFMLFNAPELIILVLGLGLVLLGAQWDRLRAALLRVLPAFPGKDRLPPAGVKL